MCGSPHHTNPGHERDRAPYSRATAAAADGQALPRTSAKFGGSHHGCFYNLGAVQTQRKTAHFWTLEAFCHALFARQTSKRSIQPYWYAAGNAVRHLVPARCSNTAERDAFLFVGVNCHACCTRQTCKCSVKRDISILTYVRSSCHPAATHSMPVRRRNKVISDTFLYERGSCHAVRVR